jgi:hypothetical protein
MLSDVKSDDLMHVRREDLGEEGSYKIVHSWTKI